jgi:hypothetical protein
VRTERTDLERAPKAPTRSLRRDEDVWRVCVERFFDGRPSRRGIDEHCGCPERPRSYERHDGLGPGAAEIAHAPALPDPLGRETPRKHRDVRREVRE